MRPTFALLLATVAATTLAAAPVHAKDKDKDKGASSGSSGNNGNGNGNNGSGNGNGSTPTPTPIPTPTAEAGGGSFVLLTTDCGLTAGCLFSGNDNKADDIVSAYESVFSMNDLSLAFSQKVEFSGQVYGGSWSSVIPVSFLSVKAGNEFILYRLSEAATSGTWSTAGLVNAQGTPHAVSHLSFFTGSFLEPTPPAASNPVPPLPSFEEPPPALEGPSDPQFPSPPVTPPVVDPMPDDPGGPLGLPDLQVTAVPEPATWISMILGFGFLGAQMRRRRAALARG